jgi:heme-degrading monooxygenase HmoA
MIPGPPAGEAVRPAEGGRMYVRVTTMAFLVDKFAEGVRVFEESVLPAARAQEGFRAAYLLSDRAAGRAVALTFWENEAAARANEKNRYYHDQLVKFLPYFTAAPVREGYEVFVEAR